MRAFIGIPVDETLTQQLQTWVKQVADTDWGQQVRWIPPQNYHLTLRFLGAKVALQKLEQLQQTMAEWFAEGMSAFEADVMRIQRFPEADQGRFIVATLDTTLLLQCLLDEIQLQLKPLGFSKPQQRFRAHITLGRLPKVNELKLDQSLSSKTIGCRSNNSIYTSPPSLIIFQYTSYWRASRWKLIESTIEGQAPDRPVCLKPRRSPKRFRPN